MYPLEKHPTHSPSTQAPHNHQGAPNHNVAHHKLPNASSSMSMRSPSPAAALHALNGLPGDALLHTAQVEHVTENIVRISKLGPRCHTDPSSKHWVNALERDTGGTRGVRHWAELSALIEAALIQYPQQAHIELLLDQYLCETLEPNDSTRQQLEQLFHKRPHRQVTLTLQQNSTTPTRRLPLNPKYNPKYNPEQTAPNADDFWKAPQGRALMSRLHEQYPCYALLLEAAQQAHDIDPNASQGLWLKRVIDRLPQSRSENPDHAKVMQEVAVPENRRSLIFEHLHKADQAVLNLVRQLNEGDASAVSEITPEALHRHPLQALFEDHKPNNSGRHCWYSIGAGQMISLLEFARKQIDIGTLPLDFTLLADNRSFEAVDEINQTGMRQSILNQLPINPKGQKPIYIFNQQQRSDALLKHRPDVIFLNVKVNALNQVITPDVVNQLLLKNDYRPTLVIPAKSYNDAGRIPYVDLYNMLNTLDRTLAEKLVVMGGFFAAPAILSHQPVDITIAAKSEASLCTLARGMSPNPINKTINNTISNKANKNTYYTDCDWLHLTLTPNLLAAAALMAGGANKNFLTYRSAYKIMTTLLENGLEGQTDKPTLSAMLEEEKERNITIGEEITSQLLSVYQLETASSAYMATHIASPRGLQEDFRNCLPANVEGLYLIKATLDRLKLTALDDSVHDDFAQLIEKVHADDHKVLGTRNARDGLIDAIIHHITHHLCKTYRYDQLYPKSWSGKYSQEGRNGIGHLLKFADQHKIKLPKAVYEAWDLYHQSSMIHQ